MIPVIIILICIHLVYKAIEIFQIAFTSSSENKKKGMIIGSILIFIALVVSGITLIYLISNEATTMRNLNYLK
jgi:NADH:ubiquinone oxidoreductase subunit K